MTDQQPTTLPAVITSPETVVQAIQKALPEMERRNKAAVEAMDAATKPTTDEEYEKNNELLVGVKLTYDKVNALRTPITKQLDELKAFLMEFERPLDYGTKAKSQYNSIRLWQEEYQQEKLNAINKEKEAAAKRKAVQDHIVDIQTAMRTNLANLMMDKTRKASDWCSTFFNTATVENFDEMEKRFCGMNPQLKQEEYKKCLDVSYNQSLINSVEYMAIQAAMLEAEPYTKWNTEYLSKIMPTINEWRGKTSQIKQQLIEKANASEADRKRIEAEQAKKKAADEEKRLADLKAQEEAQKLAISEREQRDKLANSFQQQAFEQTLDNTGPTEKVLKFEDATQAMPFTHIIYQCFAHEKFPGILKKDKDKKVVLDAAGRPEYIDHVQWWIDFYLKNVDTKKYKIDHTVLFDKAKIAVRK